MSLSPILLHHFVTPLPYIQTYTLQQTIHEWQLSQRRISRDLHRDVILTLQHRPVYTTGRRQKDEDIATDMERLTKMGADFVKTQRGGETTYHGPGQLVIYPLLDLGRMNMTVREYICLLQQSIKSRLHKHHRIQTHASEHTGVFLNANNKVASIGVQVSHRLTLHGLAMNVTSEPKSWFQQVVACGLADVKAGSVSDASTFGNEVTVEDEAVGLTDIIIEALGRETEPLLTSHNRLNTKSTPSTDLRHLKYLVEETEIFAKRMPHWPLEPKMSEAA
jgi:lipoyl(octanoyl) transferase 2